MKIVASLGKHMYWLLTKQDIPLRAKIFAWLVNLFLLMASVFLLCKAISLVD